MCFVVIARLIIGLYYYDVCVVCFVLLCIVVLLFVFVCGCCCLNKTPNKQRNQKHIGI